MFEARSFVESTKSALFEAFCDTLNNRFSASESQDRFSRYQDDPVAFGVEVLGEAYTDDVKAMMESVRDYPITIAKSANATGKTHGAARVTALTYVIGAIHKIKPSRGVGRRRSRNALFA
jgi:hypothetical protein